jgi:hypothetical protein
MDQPTRKISASQLAVVLAKADGEELGDEHEPAREDVSGQRLTAGKEARAGARAPKAAPAPVPQVLAVVERPVGDAKVVNATSPEAPPHSSGRMPAARPAQAQADAEPDPPPACPKYESLPVQLPVKSSRVGVAVVVLVLLFFACCVALVVFNH